MDNIGIQHWIDSCRRQSRRQNIEISRKFKFESQIFPLKPIQKKVMPNVAHCSLENKSQ